MNSMNNNCCIDSAELFVICAEAMRKMTVILHSMSCDGNLSGVGELPSLHNDMEWYKNISYERYGMDMEGTVESIEE